MTGVSSGAFRCLRSSVTLNGVEKRCCSTLFGRLIVVPRVTPRACLSTPPFLPPAVYEARGCLTLPCSWRFCCCSPRVHHGQRPTPAGQLPGDADRGDRGPLLPGVEGAPSLVESAVGLICPSPHGRGLPGLAADQLRRQPVLPTVMPGRFHQQPAGVTVPGLGDRALRTGIPAGVLRRHQAQERADVPAGEPLPVAD